MVQVLATGALSVRNTKHMRYAPVHLRVMAHIEPFDLHESLQDTGVEAVDATPRSSVYAGVHALPTFSTKISRTQHYLRSSCLTAIYPWQPALAVFFNVSGNPASALVSSFVPSLYRRVRSSPALMSSLESSPHALTPTSTRTPSLFLHAHHIAQIYGVRAIQ